MSAKHYSDTEIEEIAREILEFLRPRHLAVFQIRDIAAAIVELTNYIVLRERPAEEVGFETNKKSAPDVVDQGQIEIVLTAGDAEARVTKDEINLKIP